MHSTYSKLRITPAAPALLPSQLCRAQHYSQSSLHRSAELRIATTASMPVSELAYGLSIATVGFLTPAESAWGLA